MRSVRISTVTIAALFVSAAAMPLATSAWAEPVAEAATLAEASTVPTPGHGGEESAIHLFAGVEEAWAASDAERLAGMVDTTVVRIAVKPGTPLTSAVTSTAAAFLFQDQLRLVSTRSFRVVRVEATKKGTARAEAEWLGDWGGRQGVRDVKVILAAHKSGNRWLLTEVRAND